MPRQVSQKSSKPFMSMKMTKTGTDSARMTFTYKSSGNTSRRQKMEMENHSRQFIDAILETTEHKLSKIVVNEDTIEVESVSKDLVVVQESMSPELQKMIAEMNKVVDAHTDVYPPAPQPGEIAIPTGGLAICECSESCTKELPQPAYKILREDVEDRWKLDEDESENMGMSRKQKHRKTKKNFPRSK